MCWMERKSATPSQGFHLQAKTEGFNMIYHLVMTNIAMEHGSFIDGLPIKTSIYKGFSMAM